MGKVMKLYWQAVVLILLLSGSLLSCSGDPPKPETDDSSQTKSSATEPTAAEVNLPQDASTTRTQQAAFAPEEVNAMIAGMGSLIGSLPPEPVFVPDITVAEGAADQPAAGEEERSRQQRNSRQEDESWQQVKKKSRGGQAIGMRAGSSPDTLQRNSRPVPAVTGTNSSRNIAELPVFPWPPPQPSTHMMLNRRLYEHDPVFKEGNRVPTLGEVADIFYEILFEAGYWEQVYYALPDRSGIALVTRLERINVDGSPVKGSERFVGPSMRRGFSLKEIIKKLLFEPEGFFRLGVFVLTDRPVKPDTEAKMTSGQAAELLADGMTTLPRSYADLPFSKHHFY
jgi:hypothetical protein